MKTENEFYFSAQDAETARAIRDDFNENKSPIEELISLKKSTYAKASRNSIAIGVVASLFFGFGLTCFLEWNSYLLYGFVSSVIGLSLMIVNYFLYKKFLSHYKAENREQVFDLSDRIIRGN